MNKTVGKASEEYLRLLQFIQTQVDGAELMWLEIEQQTGVSMDISGKAKLREAVKKCHRRYEIISGLGIILDSKQNTSRIADRSVRSIVNEVRRGKDTFDILATRHMPE